MIAKAGGKAEIALDIVSPAGPERIENPVDVIVGGVHRPGRNENSQGDGRKAVGKGVGWVRQPRVSVATVDLELVPFVSCRQQKAVSFDSVAVRIVLGSLPAGKVGAAVA